MSQSNLEKFGAYVKGRELFDLVVKDTGPLQQEPQCWKLISQQVGSADSIAANIEEGYGRGGRKEYRHFLLISRGSARETRGRYERLHHWLPSDLIQDRINLCDEIIGILTATITRLTNEPT